MIIRHQSERKNIIDIPQNVSVNEPFEVTIHLKGFKANGTLLKILELVLTKKADIVKSDDSSSKDNDYNPPGYSTLPTVKADENGKCTN